jgi:hypothetical protein
MAVGEEAIHQVQVPQQGARRRGESLAQFEALGAVIYDQDTVSKSCKRDGGRSAGRAAARDNRDKFLAHLYSG